ncbi:FAD-binding protein [Bordetella sp. BOR01]|uniref:FAD-binding protein n=1 Tax=Bordetella sp. BOR01 TaxID=2854779 RepID=UPI001C4515B1|nr:FAD-binding protein [Bordetella sp. BOR01]MBV7483330.1 FAD-binding protein [Bordetella sp. BOR01]
MRIPNVVKRSADVLVVGGGGAASRAALSARQRGADVRLLTKAAFQAGGSTVHGASEIMSMGAAGFGVADDSRQKHFDDTMRAGRGFIDEPLVRVLAEEAPDRIRDLMALNVPFDQEGVGPKLIKSDFGSHARALGVGGRTGKAFVQALSRELLRAGVQVDEGIALVDLIRDTHGSVAGVLGYDAKSRTLVHYDAPSVVLGTGGLHSAFELQVSTAEMTGDGQAICYRHGAELVNLEFHQVGPALVHPYVQLFSGSSFRLRPRLLNSQGREFLRDYLPPDIDAHTVYEEKGFPFTATNVSRYIDIAMAHEVREGRGSPHGGVFFSFANVSADALARVLPNTMNWLGDRGIDLARDMLEVGVAFQCMNGGVRMTDANAQSTVPGLFVIGELAGGVRGPDRPGGNSLAEGQVFGHRSGVAAAQRALRVARKARALPATLEGTLQDLGGLLARKPASAHVAALTADVRRVMQRECLVEKSADGLRAALRTVRAVQVEIAERIGATPDTLLDTLGLCNMAQASELVLSACLNRDETRSAHYRLDYPETNPSLAHSYILRRGDGGPVLRRLDY